MVVGGMPQSVEAYCTGDDHRLEACERVKREILSLYEADIGRYAKGYAAKVQAILRHIPAALSTREKKFHLSNIDRNARMRRYENAFLWLGDAMIANIAYNSTNPDVGLEMNLDDSLFKCYLLDTGLLLTQAMSGTRDVDGRLLRGVLYDKLGVNEGMFFENYVAQSLMSRGYDLLFHSRSNPRVEIDFLIRNGIKLPRRAVEAGGHGGGRKDRRRTVDLHRHLHGQGALRRHPAQRPQVLHVRHELLRLRRRRQDHRRHRRDRNARNPPGHRWQLVSRAISLEQYAKPAMERRGGSLECCGPT